MVKLFRWLLQLSIAFICIITLFVLAVTLLKIPIDLTGFKRPLEAMASKALHRPVTIEKSIILSTSLKPLFTIGGLRIRNTDDFTQDTFLYLDSAHLQIELLPLLKKKLYISDFSVQTLDVTLEETKEGSVNWVFGQENETEVNAKESQEEQSSEKSARQDDKSFDITSDSVVVRNLIFDNISVSFHDPLKSKPSRYHITKCIGTMIPGEPLDLNITGNVNEFPYVFAVKLASLEEYLTRNKTWMQLELTIAETLFSFAGDVNFEKTNQTLVLQAGINGSDLSSLDNLLHLDLPPFKLYEISATLRLRKHHFKLENLEVQTGSSSLNGTAEISVENKRVTADIIFQSPLVQLDDFIFDSWSWSSYSEKQVLESKTESPDDVEKTEFTDKGDQVSSERRKFSDPQVLAGVDAHLGVTAEQVLSGEDELGNGSLELTLKDGKLAIEPLEITLPGGSASFSASLTPGIEEANAEVKAVVKNFDIGILARRSRPETNMEGLVNLDVHLTSRASSLAQVLANGNGYFDYSGQLKNIKAGIIDLWAVNLIASILSSTDENASQINCAVGRWRVNDGVLVPDVFFIDTSKIRICGTGTVDFSKNVVNLVISPVPKKAQFFSLATPIAIKGALGSLDIGIKSGGIFGTAVRFVASPLAVPVQRLFTEPIPENGSDACIVELGPENRTGGSVTGCR